MSTQRGKAEVMVTGGTVPSTVTSWDGTPIAYWSIGVGPPLLLVHGASGDHTRWAPLLPYLEPHVTVHVMDRRGRGGSGDASHYDVSREFEDVAAVVDAIEADAGTTVDVYGHSMGGLCAFGAAALTDGIRRMVLYEGWPSLDPSAWTLPAGVEEQMDAAIVSGDREGALRTFMREVVELSDEDVLAMSEQPAWQGRLAAAHTITRELRAYLDTPFDPARALAVTVPTLLVTGTESPDPAAGEVERVAAAMPDARIAVLEGQHHVADTLAPEVFAPVLLGFLGR